MLQIPQKQCQKQLFLLEREYNVDEKKGNKMSPAALRKVLIAAYAGDDSLC